MQFKWVVMQNISIFEKEQEAIKYQNLIGSQKSKAMANPRNLGFLRKNLHVVITGNLLLLGAKIIILKSLIILKNVGKKSRGGH